MRYRMGPKQIKALRLKLGLSQAIFAERVGVSRSTVIRWEMGQVEPSRLAARLLDALAWATK